MFIIKFPYTNSKFFICEAHLLGLLGEEFVTATKGGPIRNTFYEAWYWSNMRGTCEWCQGEKENDRREKQGMG